MSTSESHPHSVVYWLTTEIDLRNSDGNLIPTDKQKIYKGVMHCTNKEEAKKVLGKFLEDIKVSVTNHAKTF